MKNRYYIVIACLLVSLFIYLFYRTEKTVVNQIFIQLITYSRYSMLKNAVRTFLPLNGFIIYSLPEGLWIFCITVTSKHLYIRLGKSVIKCVFFPIIYSVGLEICQLLHVVNGRFDFMDIWVSLICWLLGLRFFNESTADQPVVKNLNTKTMVCIASYSLVYLSHVMI